MAQFNIQIDKKIFNSVYYPHLFDYSKRYNIYYGSAGSGKSVFVVQKMVIKALAQKRKVLFIRKVARTLKDSVFDLVIQTLSKFHMLSECRVNNTTFTIELPNGSVFLFKGLDDNEKIKSITDITDIVIEEATELTEDDFTQLDLRLRARVDNLQIYLMFNPISKVNWCYKHWFENTTRETFILKTTYKDNRFLPQEYIQRLEEMKERNPAYYQIYALGEFGSLDKLIFTYWREYEGEIPPNLKLLCGLDFGYVNDATAFIVSWLDEENKRIYIVDEHYEKGMRNEQIAEMIIYMGYGKEVIIADSAEQKSIDTIRDKGARRIKPATKGKGSVLQGIDKLKEYELLVSPKCANTIIELNNYAWKKDKQSNEYINEPIDDFNHCIDALRYSLQCVGNSIKFMDKSKLGL